MEEGREGNQVTQEINSRNRELMVNEGSRKVHKGGNAIICLLGKVNHPFPPLRYTQENIIFIGGYVYRKV